MKITGIAVFNDILTEEQMTSPLLWSVDVNLDAAVTVSAINTQINALAVDSLTTINLVTTNETTITVDEAFTTSNDIIFTGDSKLTLQAAAAVDFSEMANVDFSSYSGQVQRSWLTPGVVGFNFNGSGARNANSDTLNCVDTGLALESGEWLHDTSRASGSTNLFSDGISTLTWRANNVYTEANDVTGGTFIQGYLDDGGSGASISLTGVPYDEYDVIIYCSTDDASKKFKAKTVNGTVYTWDSASGAVVTTNNVLASWGSASAAPGKAVYGVNTLRINNLTGSLTILGGTNSDGARGCISAIQVMPSGTSTTPTLSVGTGGSATSVNWTDNNWNVSTAPVSGAVNINVTGDVTLTVDIETELTAVMVEGAGSLTLKTAEGGALKADSLSATVPVMIVDAGVDISTTAAATTYLYKTDSMSTSVLGNTYTAGVGSVDSAVSIALDVNGGTAILKGDENPENSVPYYISPSCNATQSTIVFTNAVAIYPTALSIGTANYIVSGLSDITCYTNTNDHGFYLCDGGAGRTSTFLLKDSSVVRVYGVNNDDSNRGVVLFGHWPGTSTFTLQDTAQFIAEGEVLVGKTGGTHTININGGTFTAQGIKLSGAAGGVNTMNLAGGVLALGDIGLTSYSASRTMTVNVSGEPAIRAQSATLPMTCAFVLAAESTLVIDKDSSVSAASVTMSGDVSGNGKLRTATGVDLALNTARPILDTLGGKITLTATAAELSDGEIKLPTTQAGYSEGTFNVIDTSGNEVYVTAVTVADSVITLAVDSNSYKEDTATSSWSDSMSGVVIIKNDADTAITLTVDEAFPSGVTSLDVFGKVLVDVSALDGYGGAVVLNITEGAEVTVKGAWPFTGVTGSGSLILESLTISTDNSAFAGTCTVGAGTVKMGHNKCFGPWGRTVTVKAGASVDSNGQGNGGSLDNSYTLKLEEGATYCNTAAPNNDTKLAFPVSQLILDGDATIMGENVKCGLARHFNQPTAVSLNTYTLTASGGNTVYFSCPTFSGTGTFKIAGGTTVVVTRQYSFYGDGQPNCSGTVEIENGGILNFDGYDGGPVFSANNLVLNGSVTRASAGSCTVNGLLSGSGVFNVPATLGESAKIKVRGKESVLFSNGFTSERDGGQIMVDVSDVDLTTARKLGVLRVPEPSMLPSLDLITGVPDGWEVVTTHDGCGIMLVKPVFYIRVR